MGSRDCCQQLLGGTRSGSAGSVIPAVLISGLVYLPGQRAFLRDALSSANNSGRERPYRRGDANRSVTTNRGSRLTVARDEPAMKHFQRQFIADARGGGIVASPFIAHEHVRH